MAENTTQDLLGTFKAIATNPDAQFKKYLSEGKQVVLTAPEYTPDELVHAMGLVPFGAWGAELQLDQAKRYFPAFICSVAQSIVELGMTGAYKGASAIIVPYLCDSLKVLGENWKQAVPEIAFIPMPYPQNRAIPAGIEFTKAGYTRITDDLAKITGQPFNQENLKESIAAFNEHNALMRRFAQVAADASEIGPLERSAVFKSAFFTTVEEHTALVKALIESLEASASKDSVSSNEVRIVTSGILADHPELLSIFAQNRLKVVADDVAAESRQYLTDAPEADTALDALAHKFAQMGNCSLLYDINKTRTQRIVTIAKEHKAQAVIVILTKFCDPEEFDIPYITKACKEAGLPSLVIEYDRQQSDLGQISTAVQAFGELLN